MVFFYFYFSTDEWCWTSLHVPTGCWYIFLEEMSIQLFANFLTIFCYFGNLLYTLDVNLYQYVICKYFFPFHGLPFILLILSFNAQFNFDVAKHIIFFFCCLYFWHHNQKITISLLSWNFPYVFIWESYNFSFHRSVIHFVDLCICKAKVQGHSFACGYLVFPALIVQKTLLSSLNDLSTLFCHHLIMYISVCF